METGGFLSRFLLSVIVFLCERGGISKRWGAMCVGGYFVEVRGVGVELWRVVSGLESELPQEEEGNEKRSVLWLVLC